MNLRDRAKVAGKVILIESAIVLCLWTIALPLYIFYGQIGDIAVSIALVIHSLIALSFLVYLAPVYLAAWIMGYD